MKQELGNLMAEDPQQETINLLTYRLNAVTIERDEWKAKFIQQNKDLGCEMMDPNGTIWDHAKKLQGDLAAVTEQRDGLRSGIDCASDQLSKVTEQRDGLHELHNKNAARSKELLELCGTLREQRDRLAEALRQIASSDPNWRDCLLIAREALAAVKGGSDE